MPDRRFKSQVSEATRLADKLSGTAAPIPFLWVHLGGQNGYEEDACTDAGTDQFDDELSCLVHDALEVIHNHDGTCDPETEHLSSLSTAQAMPPITKDLLLCNYNPVSDSNIPSGPRSHVLHLQYVDCTDTVIWLPPISQQLPQPPPESCSIPPTAEGPRVSFDRISLTRLSQSDGWLNDECLNSGSLVLLRYLGTAAASGELALFPTWTVSQHRRGSDEGVWRSCRTLQFWEKDLWIIPIHQDSHWTLAIIYWQKRRIALFDSLGDNSRFEEDVKVWLHIASARALSDF